MIIVPFNVQHYNAFACVKLNFVPCNAKLKDTKIDIEYVARKNITFKNS